ncbi:uncharacterized protein FOMMEDRAFT_144711 [Fomitiporia mediterranea MF3/22]|uniref:uncharacterized protein n=1 Tax=Fomitiporia mediterranea (strain MF3/22) TaxID=694068 RepID=UPI0004407E5B|nr:uncharacterized protein FOMMEDRAFT_144711 [Fomitiporia mediterranea MF3/22]EJD06831.1 hypothetical protein FOMMEDRAFT_144711 [Fomitiporia mediterranea MF3/22]
MTSTTNRITLYDAEFTLEEKTMSPYAVRIRLLLHYKNIPYDVVWLRFRDVDATAKAVGAAPTRVMADGSPGYTIPFITTKSVDDQTIAISDSARIAQYIEENFPDSENKLLPAETRFFQSIFSKYLIEKVSTAIYGVALASILDLFPSESDREWYLQTRRNVYGRGIEELVPQDEASIQAAWRRFDTTFDDLAAHLDKAGEGNYRITGGVSYSEFELVSWLNMARRASYDGVWKRLASRNGGRWEKLMNLPVYKEILPANRNVSPP